MGFLFSGTHCSTIVCMTHTLIQILSYSFIINQPKVSFQFLIFRRVLHDIYIYIPLFLSSLTFWDCKWDPLPLTLTARGRGGGGGAQRPPRQTLPHTQTAALSAALLHEFFSLKFCRYFDTKSRDLLWPKVNPKISFCVQNKWQSEFFILAW